MRKRTQRLQKSAYPIETLHIYLLCLDIFILSCFCWEIWKIAIFAYNYFQQIRRYTELIANVLRYSRISIQRLRRNTVPHRISLNYAKNCECKLYKKMYGHIRRIDGRMGELTSIQKITLYDNRWAYLKSFSVLDTTAQT